jgi:hypothetical protein
MHIDDCSASGSGTPPIGPQPLAFPPADRGEAGEDQLWKRDTQGAQGCISSLHKAPLQVSLNRPITTVRSMPGKSAGFGNERETP